MTKQALIERLAEIEYHGPFSPDQVAVPWEQASVRAKEFHREQVMRYWPVIADFVENFIITECRKDIDAETCAQRWREAKQ